ncbi:mechanosensitive ion channel family protein [Paenibacillus sanguinis]|uniref:mechanosensitive ion channel family protein n=1 Tax=Paenibacillus sanguinis TaxID=225906 RepID=UPI000376523D|nr:mechanosensitive ion channel family protein [Paenibacillus sanguinis]
MEFIQNWLAYMGVADELIGSLSIVIGIIGIIIVSMAAHFVAKGIILKIITYSIRNNRIKWDNYILERKVFHKLVHVVPAIIIYYSASLFPAYQGLIAKGVVLYIIVISLMVVNAFLNAVHDIYATYEIAKIRPIRGYIQVAKIFIFTIGGILLISALIGQSPVFLLSGIGALSAVIMLIFKDSILGLVAGVQLTSNDMVRVGDWIEMPKYGADGDIVDISLNTVKVQNFDKTITTIPTYALVSDSFKNWRGMQSSGGRRIKRSVFVDTSSIVFADPEMLDKFKKIHYLREYIAQKETDIEQYNLEHRMDRSVKANGRALTNIGIFRAYILRYLQHHPSIHQNMTCIVRQLQPTETGLPLEIYAFVNDINWAVYEEVQSDIFDHIFAVAPEFGLRIFQNPTGHDLQHLLKSE